MSSNSHEGRCDVSESLSLVPHFESMSILGGIPEPTQKDEYRSDGRQESKILLSGSTQDASTRTGLLHGRPPPTLMTLPTEVLHQVYESLSTCDEVVALQLTSRFWRDAFVRRQQSIFKALLKNAGGPDAVPDAMLLLQSRSLHLELKRILSPCASTVKDQFLEYAAFLDAAPEWPGWTLRDVRFVLRTQENLTMAVAICPSDSRVSRFSCLFTATTHACIDALTRRLVMLAKAKEQRQPGPEIKVLRIESGSLINYLKVVNQASFADLKAHGDDLDEDVRTILDVETLNKLIHEEWDGRISALSDDERADFIRGVFKIQARYRATLNGPKAKALLPKHTLLPYHIESFLHAHATISDADRDNPVARERWQLVQDAIELRKALESGPLNPQDHQKFVSTWRSVLTLVVTAADIVLTVSATKDRFDTHKRIWFCPEELVDAPKYDGGGYDE